MNSNKFQAASRRLSRADKQIKTIGPEARRRLADQQFRASAMTKTELKVLANWPDDWLPPGCNRQKARAECRALLADIHAGRRQNTTMEILRGLPVPCLEGLLVFAESQAVAA